MKKIIYIPILFTILLFTSCEDVVQIELYEDDAGLYVVEAIITTNENPYVYLTKSLPVSTLDANPSVSGATVRISDDETPSNSINLVESAETPGLYLVPQNEEYFGVANRTYTLNIENDGEIITAVDKLLPVAKIDTMKIRPSLRGDKLFLGVFISSQEPTGLGDFYKWDIYINDKYLGDYDYMFVTSDEGVDGNYVNDLEIFTDFHDPNEEDERILKFNDTVFVKQTSISSQVYDFYFQAIYQNNSGTPFSVPPANVQNNLVSNSGKAVLGLFSAHDVSVSNALIINEDIESQLKKR